VAMKDALEDPARLLLDLDHGASWAGRAVSNGAARTLLKDSHVQGI
jgi:hypothetical protein